MGGDQLAERDPVCLRTRQRRVESRYNQDTIKFRVIANWKRRQAGNLVAIVTGRLSACEEGARTDTGEWGRAIQRAAQEGHGEVGVGQNHV